MANNKPIGLYDSGVGGLSVLKEISNKLPNESLVYFADSARVPYGKKTQQEIIQYNKEVVEFLISQGVKVIIAACNTSSAIALPYIQKLYNIPIIGLIDYGSKMASKYKKIGVIATEGTVNSKAYSNKLKELNPSANIYEQACPILVPVVEMGVIHNKWTSWLVYQSLIGLLDKDIEALILGCTHFPHLSHIIQEIIGNKVKLLDPAKQLAKSLSVYLEKNNLLSTKRQNYKYFTTGSPEHFNKVAKIILPNHNCKANYVKLDLTVRAISA